VSRSILTVPVQKIDGESVSPVQDLLAVEEPLEIRIGARPVSITMRTPGREFELAAGFLFTEGILTDARQIESIRYTNPNGNSRQAHNSVTVELKPDVEIDFAGLERHFYTTSSCGICGKASIEAIEAKGCAVLPRNTPVVPSAVIHALPDVLRQSQAVFDRTGGLHASALFDDSGNLLDLREDVGRHNALDKLVGSQVLAGALPLSERILVVSGRVSFEIVQKAAVAGIPIICAVSAPSDLAIEAADRLGVTLVGFLRGDGFNVYAGEERIDLGN
jgi:FdhD protein